jgi:threonine dehydrogenase-like Zn-dependent dehydrogenase
MPNAVVMTGYGPPEVLTWAAVPLPEPGQGQIRIKVQAAGISPTDLALRAGYLKAFPLPPKAVLGFEAAGQPPVTRRLNLHGGPAGDIRYRGPARRAEPGWRLRSA